MTRWIRNGGERERHAREERALEGRADSSPNLSARKEDHEVDQKRRSGKGISTMSILKRSQTSTVKAQVRTNPCETCVPVP